HIHYRAALNAILISPGTLWINIALVKTVVARIRINNAANGPVLGGDFRLDAAPRAAIPSDDDLAFDVDSAFFQLFVIGRNPVIDVNERTSDIAVYRVCVIRRELLGLLAGRSVFIKRGFVKFEGEPIRGGHLD